MELILKKVKVCVFVCVKDDHGSQSEFCLTNLVMAQINVNKVSLSVTS